MSMRNTMSSTLTFFRTALISSGSWMNLRRWEGPRSPLAVSGSCSHGHEDVRRLSDTVWNAMECYGKPKGATYFAMDVLADPCQSACELSPSSRREMVVTLPPVSASTSLSNISAAETSFAAFALLLSWLIWSFLAIAIPNCQKEKNDVHSILVGQPPRTFSHESSTFHY
ncbi:hypothetical protein BC830DRAFT_115232 [Chytriomyces sp. MP71]|nr:hypothetical protein BC830DRAFT_115232 [Chytriomyces sp. MP71]